MAINMEEWEANCNHSQTFGAYFSFDCSAPQHPSSLLLDFLAILNSTVVSKRDFFSELRSWLYTAQRTQGTNFCSHYLLLTHEIIRVCLKEYFNPKKAKGAYEITWLKHVIRGLIDGVNSGATHASGNIISIILLNICLFTRRFCLIKRMSYVIDCGKGSSPKSWYTCMSWSSGSNAVFPNLKVKESFIAYDFLLCSDAGCTQTRTHTYKHTHKCTHILATSGTSTTVISKSSPKTRSTTLISAFLLVNFCT